MHVSDDGVDEIRREMERNALRIQNGIKLAMGAQFARVGPTPKETVWSRGKVELWRYDDGLGARIGPPVLLVPSVVSRSYVFDLHRGNSFVERLLEAGLRGLPRGLGRRRARRSRATCSRPTSTSCCRT